MDDLEMVRLCAEAMGTAMAGQGDLRNAAELLAIGKYDPLHDDAQCFALVKRFWIAIQAPFKTTPQWEVEVCRVHGGHTYTWSNEGHLNRAICECVAKMQSTKKGA